MDDVRWKTMRGEVLEFYKMTDLHIDNAIEYWERRDKNIKSLYYLRKEKERRRIQKKKDGAKTECPWCAPGDMELVEVEHEDPFPDVGFGSVEYYHYLLCPNCGARGPKKKGKI